MTMVSRVEVTDLSKKYDTSIGLLDASFVVNQPAVVGIIGPNGAGKTTLLRLLAGVITPTSGRFDIQSHTGSVAWSPQASLIDWSLTVRQNIEFQARLLGLPKSDAGHEADSAIDLLQLGTIQDREVEGLSGGELKRVQIARAIVGDPGVLLLDEPASGLDPEGAEVVFDNLRSRVERGDIIFASSHDLSLLEGSATHLLELAGGRLVYSGLVDNYVKTRARTRKLTVVTNDVDSATEILSRVANSVDVADKTVMATLEVSADVGEILRLLLNTTEVDDIAVDSPSLRGAFLEASE